MNINVEQDRTQWTTLSYPSVTWEKFVTLFCIFTAHFEFSYISLIISKNLPPILRFSNLEYRPLCLTESCFLEVYKTHTQFSTGFLKCVLIKECFQTKNVITGSVAFSKANLRDMYEFFFFTHRDKSTI